MVKGVTLSIILTSAPTETPDIDKGQQADDTSKKDIKVGDTVKVNFSASKWATGEISYHQLRDSPIRC